MLRTGEILALYPYQILLGETDGIIQLGLTKTGLRRQQDENVIIQHTPTLVLLKTVLEIRRRNRTMHVPLIPGGGPVFRQTFDRSIFPLANGSDRIVCGEEERLLTLEGTIAWKGL